MVSTADVRIYECFADTLAQRYGQSEVAEILNSARHTYYDEYLIKHTPDVLNESINQCRACTDVCSVPSAGWWNHNDPDFLIVASNSHKDTYWINVIGGLLKTTGFSSAFCGVVHLTKCDTKDKVSDQMIENCYPFVYQQIDASKPRCIAIVGAPAFELFRTNQNNYKEAIGSSWWWGLYKIYCLPPVKEFTDNPTAVINVLKQCYAHTYGISGSDLITLANEK